MGRLLKNLVLALLNATLLLAAVCLFLLWQLSKTVDRIAVDFASNLEIVAPLNDEIQTVRDEVAGLRADLASLQSGSSELSAEARARIGASSARIEAQLDEMRDSLRDLAGTPERLVDHAITTAAESFGAKAAELRGCTAPEPSPTS
ncbi:hypothetical protein [Pukyongiella litopenaei]|uniref:Uncharacterized protein n=1 Tax=Pukyongiella litopenaei TaxID=2605946 RepID=A0A2S0MU03_9RHOB|nr:hypothetical protein [Pukyongiella litopenaei]AVO39342.1 hypothetical protein C6Y53_17665 [Pukyongiella litopenaei]